jgi:uncharacterized OB-fold protein
MKVVRVICVDCGLGRSPLTRECPRCEAVTPSFSAKVEVSAPGERVAVDWKGVK